VLLASNSWEGPGGESLLKGNKEGKLVTVAAVSMNLSKPDIMMSNDFRVG
jgi:hypothetical protein